MTMIAVLLETSNDSEQRYRAVAGEHRSEGRTVGQALDSLTKQMGGTADTTLVVVQPFRPDPFFTADQQRRLQELMARWRNARDGQATLSADEQAELEALVASEVQASAQRAAALLDKLAP
jgi:hypothetical protein